MITIGNTAKSDTVVDEFLEYWQYPPLWWLPAANKESEG